MIVGEGKGRGVVNESDPDKPKQLFVLLWLATPDPAGLIFPRVNYVLHYVRLLSQRTLRIVFLCGVGREKGSERDQFIRLIRWQSVFCRKTAV